MSIEPGQRILDVATGSGNVALRAAKAGAEVIGLDLTPALLDKAQQRADDWGVQVDWQGTNTLNLTSVLVQASAA